MNEREERALVERYLDRLSRALADVPAEARRELLEDVRGHIDEAWAAEPDRSREALQAILQRLGEPEALAAEERERLGLPAIPPHSHPGLLEWAAIVLTAVFTPIGLILAWLSTRWQARDKAIATGIALVGLALLCALSFPAMGLAVVPVQRTTASAATQLPATVPLAVALAIVAVWGPSLGAAVFLARRLRPAPAGPLVLVPIALAVLACLAVVVISFAPLGRPMAPEPAPAPVQQYVP